MGTDIISANNRGLRFGDGIFETIKSVNSRLEFLDEHFARLWKGLKILQFNIPKHFTPEILQQEIESLLHKNRHLHLARIRLTVFRGDGGLYDATDNKPNYIIQSWASPAETGNWNTNGLVLGIYKDAKKSCDILSNLKHNNFLPYAMGAMYAKNEKWNDAVILNSYGRICETTFTNIFLIKGDVIYTPALAEGCIAGIMRENMIRKLKAGNYQLMEGKIELDELLEADEVFLTNSIYNMRWVQSIGDKKYTNQKAQKIFAAVFSTNQ
ncbi:MAG: aminotransferase class IV [Ferruginibacter sp.]|nr:aminotransferase class IV [Ferruginibacter sp.]